MTRRATRATAPTVDTPATHGAETTEVSRAILETETIPPAPAIAEPEPNNRSRAMALPDPSDASPAQSGQRPSETQSGNAALDTIRALGHLLDDLERVRIANGNRIGALEREHGESLPHLDVIQKQTKALEHLAELELVRAWRQFPLSKWAADIPGLGEKTVARLIAIIATRGEKSPYEFAPLYAPNVAKLWAYCGHGDPARKRAKGMGQEELFKLGNPDAKKRVWLIASSCLKLDGKPDVNGKARARSPYRDVYDSRKAATEGRLHDKPCVRCGPAGKPAAPGSPWSDAHRHADALRIVGKTFLKDLWVAARQGAYENQIEAAGQVRHDAHGSAARHRRDETHSPIAGHARDAAHSTLARHTLDDSQLANAGGDAA